MNEKGAERAIATGAVKTLGFPYSISPEFLRRNQNQTQEESCMHSRVDHAALADDAGLDVVAYISMAFGNPYGDPWSSDAVIDGVRAIADRIGVHADIARGHCWPREARADRGDRMPRARSERRRSKLACICTRGGSDAPSLIRAAFDAGCRRFDSAIGGLGGCPFAQDELVGNLPTETLVAALTECGATLPKLEPLDDLIRASAEIAAIVRCSTIAQLVRGPQRVGYGRND